MILSIIIAFASLIGLLVLHELGHFFFAKKFGVKVEEFGIGYPPRIFGKKIGETIYSLNLLPFGAFVRIYGSDKKIEEPNSYSEKTFWQKFLILFGGVASFWIIAIVLLTFVMSFGFLTDIEDSDVSGVSNPKIQIVGISSDSPSQKAGLVPGDFVIQASCSGTPMKIDKIKDFQSITQECKGKETIISVQRADKFLDISLIPRVSSPNGEGPMGVALVRTAVKSFPWYSAPIEAIKRTAELTAGIFTGWWNVIGKAIKQEPTGTQLFGPVGIMGLFVQASQVGWIYFMQFIALISVNIAVFNLLPIPVADGGKILILIIEKIRKKAFKETSVAKVDLVFFMLLIAVALWVTVKDVQRFF
jgi:regulator of sigma E protease